MLRDDTATIQRCYFPHFLACCFKVVSVPIGESGDYGLPGAVQGVHLASSCGFLNS